MVLEAKVMRIQKDIESIAQFTSTPGKGVTRLSYTDEDRQARVYIKDRMVEAGLHVYEDAAGNIIGRRQGQIKNAPIVMLGSHFDSVNNAGSFDGVAGVAAALEMARVFNEHGIVTKYPIEFVAFIEEEGTRFGPGLFGSRAMIGDVTKEELNTFSDDDGIPMACAMRDFGFDPDKIEDAVKKDLKAFIELHIEQGPILENANLDVGIVEAIIGLRQYYIEIEGRADHAGTTPMNMRADALVGAADIIMFINNIAKGEGEGTVATVGKMAVSPGAANIVPGKVTFTLDIRSIMEENINRFMGKVNQHFIILQETYGVTCQIREEIKVRPVQLSKTIIDALSEACNIKNIKSKRMVSGAGHDAMIMAQITDTGMLFVPSKGGRSHCPEEWTDYIQLKTGVDILMDAVIKMDER